MVVAMKDRFLISSAWLEVYDLHSSCNPLTH